MRYKYLSKFMIQYYQFKNRAIARLISIFKKNNNVLIYGPQRSFTNFFTQYLERNFFVNIKKGAYELELLLIIVLNTIFVFFLYVFIWSNVEYESSYRYLLNIFHIIIFYFLITVDSFLSFKK